MKTKLNSFGKLVILLFMFASTVSSQSITNTLGTNGLFTIKDSTHNYFTLSQATGQVNILKTLRLTNTTSAGYGVIFKGDDRFLHNFGVRNMFLGVNSGNFTMSSAYDNIGIGQTSLSQLTTGDGNIAIGHVSLSSNTSGSSNTAIGFYSLNLNTSGEQNTAIGVSSLFENTTGTGNSALGYGSLKFNTSGTSNTAFGYHCLYSNSTGNFNTAYGSSSLTNSTGNFNTALGYATGNLVTTGTNLTLIGNNAEPTLGSTSNQITLGNNQITSLRCNVQTITSLSDMRDKKNIEDLTLGLDFLMKLKPRSFKWDKREWYDNNISDGSKTSETLTAGFIAQELDEVQTSENADWLNLVLKDNPEKIEASYGNLLPVMVKAIQELKAENNELKEEVRTLRSISEKVNMLEQLVYDRSNQNTFTKKISAE